MTKRAYEAGYKDARADALYEVSLAIRDVMNGERFFERFQQAIQDIKEKEMPCLSEAEDPENGFGGLTHITYSEDGKIHRQAFKKSEIQK